MKAESRMRMRNRMRAENRMRMGESGWDWNKCNEIHEEINVVSILNT